MKVLRATVLVLGAVLIAALNLAAQSPGRNAARGSDDGQHQRPGDHCGHGCPVRWAEVRLSSRGSYNRLVTTDGDGLFNLSDLPSANTSSPSRAAVSASMIFGQRRPLEAPALIKLSEGNRSLPTLP